MAVKVIKVPKTPKSAFDASRRVSSLLQAQIAHLEAAVAERQVRPAAARRAPRGEVLAAAAPAPARRVRTEGAAARYIAELTSALRPPAPAAPPAPVEAPAAAPAPAAPAARAPRATRAKPAARTRARRPRARRK